MTLVTPLSIALSKAPPRSSPTDVTHSTFSDRITRLISENSMLLPVWLQNRLRDSGTLRSLLDNLITMSVPFIAAQSPSSTLRFLRLTSQMETVLYGSHKMQKVEVFFPSSDDKSSLSPCRGMVFFVHGGAWGSGMPWMYRLIASPFLDMGLAVSIIGYRTFPDGNVQDQVDDLEQAIRALRIKYLDSMIHFHQKHLANKKTIGEDTASYSWLGLFLVGHSSGAHIGLLLLLRLIQYHLRISHNIHANTGQFNDRNIFDGFIGLSGVYSISHHFDFEAWRGVEEISPMKPACGFSRQAFSEHSLLHLLWQSLMMIPYESTLSTLFPRTLFVHGVEDCTVPFTSTSDAAYTLRSCGVDCSEVYLPKVGHQDTIMHVMQRGVTIDVCTRFIEKNHYALPVMNYDGHIPLLQSKL